MESGYQGAVPATAQKIIHPRAHFVGGFVGEGDGEDARAGDAVLAHKVRHAMGDYAGFTAPGAGQQQQRAFHVRCGGLLLGIQTLKKIHFAICEATQCRGETKRF